MRGFGGKLAGLALLGLSLRLGCRDLRFRQAAEVALVILAAAGAERLLERHGEREPTALRPGAAA
jgi:hypothetical protein